MSQKHKRVRRSKRSTRSKRMVQRGGFLNLQTLYKAIGIKSAKDEEKAIAAINDLHKLYSGISFDKYQEADKTELIKLKEKILDEITKTQGSFETISQDITKLEMMMSDAQKRNNKDVTKTKAYPTPKEIEVVTPTPKEQGSVQEPAVQAPAVQAPAVQAPAVQAPAVQEQAETQEGKKETQLLDTPSSGGKRKTKKRGKKKKKKSKSRKYPKTKKHYNQKGGRSCSPLITPAKVNPFQGFAWKGENIKSWPGVAGIDGASNYYSPNQYNQQPGMYPDMVSGIYSQ